MGVFFEQYLQKKYQGDLFRKLNDAPKEQTSVTVNNFVQYLCMNINYTNILLRILSLDRCVCQKDSKYL